MPRAQDVERVGRNALHYLVGAVAKLEPVDLPVAVRHVVHAIDRRRGERHLRLLVTAKDAPRVEDEETVRAALVARGPQAQCGRCPYGASHVGNRRVVVHLPEGAKR